MTELNESVRRAAQEAAKPLSNPESANPESVAKAIDETRAAMLRGDGQKVLDLIDEHPALTNPGKAVDSQGRSFNLANELGERYPDGATMSKSEVAAGIFKKMFDVPAEEKLPHIDAPAPKRGRGI